MPYPQLPDEKPEDKIKKAQKILAGLTKQLDKVQTRKTLFKIEDDAFSIDTLIAEIKAVSNNKPLEIACKKLQLECLQLKNRIDTYHLHFDLASRLSRLAALSPNDPKYINQLATIHENITHLKELAEPPHNHQHEAKAHNSKLLATIHEDITSAASLSDLAARVLSLVELSTDHPDYVNELNNIYGEITNLKRLAKATAFSSSRDLVKTDDSKTQPKNKKADKKLAPTSPLTTNSWFQEKNVKEQKDQTPAKPNPTSSSLNKKK